MVFEIEIEPENLIKAGYKEQWNGFVRNKTGGRFHASLRNRKIKQVYRKVLDIHFDFFIKSYGHPSTFYTPNLLKEEVERIKKYGY